MKALTVLQKAQLQYVLYRYIYMYMYTSFVAYIRPKALQEKRVEACGLCTVNGSNGKPAVVWKTAFVLINGEKWHVVLALHF